MELRELMALQTEFDRSHHANRPFYVDITKDNLGDLEHLVVCLVGEIGEFANLLKKVVRGDFDYASASAPMKDEIADIFIYLLKISAQTGIDLEAEFLRKLEANKSRFSSSGVID